MLTSTSTFAFENRQRRVATTGTTARERRIEEAAEGHLQRSGYLALQDIGCTCREGVVTLWGCLPTYYLKQIAQHVVAELEGVCGIINQIEVLASSGRHARWNSPGVAIGQDGADLGVSPSLEDLAVTV
ncbi:MAG: BON domain-containing protein [Planctomycetaceae bacterium]|nr:BON domain-containing protein [Planctomycetaceae bacterium]